MINILKLKKYEKKLRQILYYLIFLKKSMTNILVAERLEQSKTELHRACKIKLGPNRG